MYTVTRNGQAWAQRFLGCNSHPLDTSLADYLRHLLQDISARPLTTLTTLRSHGSTTSPPPLTNNSNKPKASDPRYPLYTPTRYTSSGTISGGSSTVNRREAEKFAQLADQWWDLSGPFAPLHQLNPVRCSFIRTALCDHYALDPDADLPLEGLTILDVGCGGGILSESLARMGAQVTGIDVREEGLVAAQAHADLDPNIAQRITYKQTPVEDLAAVGDRFDAVMASEVIEHVDSVPQFCGAVAEATKPGGAVIVSTINRTPQAYALAVAAAEHILKLVPKGTHEWNRFIKPEELVKLMKDEGSLHLEQMAGMVFDPLKMQWELSKSVSVNYIAYFTKPNDIARFL